MKRSAFGRDVGLQTRMLVTMLLLGVVYVVLVGALFAAGARGVTLGIVAVGLFLFQLAASDRLALSAMGAHEVSPQEAPQLHATIERLCVQADLPKPKIAIVESRMPNAFAMGRSQKSATVCATTGILDLLEPAELEGVMAHELTHVINRDVVVMTIVSFFAGIASLIIQFGFFFGGGGDEEGEGDSFGILIVVSIGVAVVSFFLMRMLSRYREFAADRGAAVITGRPSALASALLKISGTIERVPQQDLRAATGNYAAFFIIPASAKNSLANVFATHPPLAKRLAALSRLEEQLQSSHAAGLR